MNEVIAAYICRANNVILCRRILRWMDYVIAFDSCWRG